MPTITQLPSSTRFTNSEQRKALAMHLKSAKNMTLAGFTLRWSYICIYRIGV